MNGGDKELLEKLGRNDPCPCGPPVGFKNCCLQTSEFDGSDRHHFRP